MPTVTVPSASERTRAAPLPPAERRAAIVARRRAAAGRARGGGHHAADRPARRRVGGDDLQRLRRQGRVDRGRDRGRPRSRSRSRSGWRRSIRRSPSRSGSSLPTELVQRHVMHIWRLIAALGPRTHRRPHQLPPSPGLAAIFASEPERVRVEPVVAARRLAGDDRHPHPSADDPRTGDARGDRRRLPARRGDARRDAVSLRRLLESHLWPYRRLVARRGRAAIRADVRNADAADSSAPDLINHGVLEGDNAYIWRIGAIMLAFSLRADRVRDHRGSIRRPDGDVLRARRAARPLPQGDRLLGPRGRQVRRALADHSHHQRRATDPGRRRACSRR